MGYDPPIVEGPADGDQSNGGSGAGGLAIYGDGHLGDVVIDEDTVLDHTIYADNVTVQAGFTLDLNHWPIYARDTLTVEAGATVHNDGLSAVGVTPGTASTYATPLSPGGYGGEFGGGINGFTTYIDGLDGRFGGVGGAAGNGNGRGPGDGGQDADSSYGLILQRSAFGGGAVIPGDGSTPSSRTAYAGGSGGGAGENAGDIGGSGGSGGGVALILARRIVNNGTIRAHGGNGGDAAVGTLPAWEAETTYMSGQVIAPVGAAHVYQADLGSDTASGTDEPLWTDDDNPVIEGDIVWSDLGVQGAGGGAGGQGGLVVIGYDTYTGSAPSIDGGTGGAGTGSGEDGGGGDGGLIIDLPNAD